MAIGAVVLVRVFFLLFSLKESFLVALDPTHVFTEVWPAEFISQEDVLGVSGLPPLRLTQFYVSFETTEKLSMLHPKKGCYMKRKSLCLLYLRRIMIWHDLIMG